MIRRRRMSLCQVIPILALMFANCASNLRAQSIDVAVVGVNAPAAWNQDVQHKLMSTGFFRVVDVIDVSSADSIPLLSTLQQYNAVLVYGAADLPGAGADKLGDALASYFERGGGVLDMASLNTQGSLIGGRFRSAGYALLSPGATVAGGHLTLGSFATVSLLRGATTFDGGTSSFYSLGQPVSDANVVALWINNAPLAIIKPILGFTRVTLNFFPVSSDVRQDFWDAQIFPDIPAVPGGARLMANALVAVVQPKPQAGRCVLTIAPSSLTVNAQGFGGQVAVTTSDPDCEYVATSDAPWVHPPTGSAVGSFDLGFSVDPNPGAARSTTIHVGGSDFTLNQAAGNVPGFALTPALAKALLNRAFNSTVTVTAENPASSWTSVSNAPWIHVTSPSPQTGNGTVSYSVDQNPGPRRVGTITIAGLTFIAIQGGANCFFTLNSTVAFAPVAGGPIGVDVNASSGGCPWTAASESPFITITSGSPGTGSGTVNLGISANPSSFPRVGRIRVGMQRFPVVQSGAEAVYAINPVSADFTAVGGTGSTSLTVTPADATWLAVTDVPWIILSAPTSGSGNANINYSVSANPGAARSGHLVVGGKIFTVNQSQGTAGFTLNPQSANFDAAGGSRSVNVTQTGAPSAWSATSDVAWITITAGSNGVGNGTVNYTVAANPGANVRTGSMTIAGNAFNVTQSGNGGPSAGSRFVPVIPCRIADTRNAVGPYGGPILAGGVRRTFSVTAANCGIPASAQAFSLNITAVPNGPLGFLTAWPTGQPQPLVSTLNSGDGRVVANAAIVPSGTGGGVDIFVTDNSHVVIDINGYFDSQNAAALPFFTVTPCRVADTRNADGPFGGPALAPNVARSFNLPAGPCGIPASAQAYSLNATAIPSGPLGFLTLWPSSQPQPQVSTLNSFDGRIVANAAIVSAGASGAVSAFAAGTTNLVLDTNGYFGPTGNTPALSFFPITPCRVADTRNANGPFGGPFVAAGGTRAFAIPQSNCGVPANASAYSLNITAVPRGVLQFLTIWPADRPQPLVSTLNSFQGAIVANAAIVPAAADGSVKVFTSEASDVVIDINGYFASTP